MSNANSAEYVLVTAAYNEERMIKGVLESVVHQTQPPAKWIVVSDGSNDRTDQIVGEYSDRYSFVKCIRLDKTHKRNFGAQVDAINEGCKTLASMHYAFIGNLDADVSFEPDYFERLLERFQKNQKLGLAGGYITEEVNGAFRDRKRNSRESVAHAVQLFRRECFEQIGGYKPLRFGGPDWYAVVRAQMLGWEVYSFPELPVRHNRPTGTAETWMRNSFREGCMDYSLGSHPVFELIKCFRRFGDAPRVRGAATRLLGFAWCYWKHQEREVTSDFVEFLRAEQMRRVFSLFGVNARRG